jgi:two-component system KDP operon response regulator KdpE
MLLGRVVFLVTAEPQVSRSFRVAFNQFGAELCECASALDAAEIMDSKAPDVVLLDLRAQEAGDVQTTRFLRERTAAALLTFSDAADAQAKIDVLDAGADDYLTIPFDSGEMLARARAVLRRTQQRDPGPPDETFRLGGLEVDFGAREVRIHGKAIHLTPTEYRLLGVLIASAGKVVPHERLLAQVWGPEAVDQIQYLRVFMKQLRQKLDHAASGPRYLVTEPSVGYRLRAPAPRNGSTPGELRAPRAASLR